MSIQISGEASVKIKPDLAQFSFHVITRASQASEATEKNAEATKAVIDALKPIVGETSLKSKGCRVRRSSVWERRKEERDDQDFYARNSFECLCSADLAGKVVSILSELEVEDIEGPAYLLKNPNLHYDEVRKSAFEEAKRIAKVYAKIGGFKVGSVESLTQHVSYNAGGRGGRMTAYAQAAPASAIGGEAAPEMSFESDEVEISASVTVSFVIK